MTRASTLIRLIQELAPATFQGDYHPERDPYTKPTIGKDAAPLDTVKKPHTTLPRRITRTFYSKVIDLYRKPPDGEEEEPEPDDPDDPEETDTDGEEEIPPRRSQAITDPGVTQRAPYIRHDDDEPDRTETILDQLEKW